MLSPATLDPMQHLRLTHPDLDAFRHRSLAGETYPYLWLDAKYVKVRDDGRVVNMAALVATGVEPSIQQPRRASTAVTSISEATANPTPLGAVSAQGLP